MPRAKTQGAQDCFPKRYILVKCPMGRKICNACRDKKTHIIKYGGDCYLRYAIKNK